MSTGYRAPLLLSVLGLSAVAASPALGYLGSFTPNDGYQIISPWVDVSYFNTGQYGANAGGGGVNYVAPNSGLWKVTSNNGAIFTSAAARAAATSGAPPYGSPPSTGTAPVYIVGNHFGGRTDNSALAFRNDTPAGTGAAQYDYSIDSYDTGGVTPSTVTSGPVSMNFWAMASPSDPVNPGGRAGDKFIMSIKSASGNIGAQWGYARDNEVYWRAGSSGPWNYTGLYINSGQYDNVKFNIDLSTQTFGLNYFQSSTSSTVTLASLGTPLGASMNNFTTIGWELTDNLSSGIGGKNFFDDFSFQIPAPSSAMLLGLGGLGAMRRRRR